MVATQDPASRRLTIILSVGLAAVIGFGIAIGILLGQRTADQPTDPTGQTSDSSISTAPVAGGAEEPGATGDPASEGTSQSGATADATTADSSEPTSQPDVQTSVEDTSATEPAIPDPATSDDSTG